MKALTRLVAATATAVCAAVAIGCDNHATPVIDTTSTTGADLNAAGDMRDAGVSSAAAPATAEPLPPAIELDGPVVKAPPPKGAYAAPSANLGEGAVAPVTNRAASNRAATNADNGPGTTFVGSSFGSAPAAPLDGTPPSPPSDNHGNGTLGSSTGSHAFGTSTNAGSNP